MISQNILELAKELIGKDRQEDYGAPWDGQVHWRPMRVPSGCRHNKRQRNRKDRFYQKAYWLGYQLS